ncbi:MAG TPA: putative lipid II flippase FtsW [Planctomycetota bacterium]|nr:putative lipid II flippase FtsW [Planctomycetota bacterium]
MENTRYAIVGCVVTLMCIGMVAVYSGGASLYGTDHGYLKLAERQMMWLVISAIVLFIFSAIDYHWLCRHARLILLASFVLLASVHVFGTVRNGARRWLIAGPISVQPAEFFKIAIVIYMAWFLSTRGNKIREFLHGFMPPVLIAGAAFTLIVTQPDFGSAVLTCAVVFTMLVVAGVNLMHALPMAMAALPIIIYMVVKVPYRLRRVLAFLDPWSDPRGTGYHIVQSVIAFGSGGPSGVGIGAGAHKGGFVPEHLTDFIFTVIGEELGFLGTAAVLAIYVMLLWLGLRVVRRAPDTMGSLLAFGIMLTIALQTVINVGVVIGMLPTKGLPLPFLSAGGSSTIAIAAGVGMVLNIASHCREEEAVRMLGAERAAVEMQ